MVEMQKMKLTVGNFHIEYEGELKDLTDHLPGVLEIVTEYVSRAPMPTPTGYNEFEESKAAPISGRGDGINSTTNTIATRLKCKSCSELALAAAAHLHFVKKKLEFSRKDLLAEIQSAKGFYKPSFKGSNLDGALKKLISDKMLNECGKDSYALCPSAITALESKIAAA